MSVAAVLGDVAGLTLDEETLEAVVIPGRERVELVIVTLGALERDAEEGARRRVDDVDEDVVALSRPIDNTSMPDA